MLYWPARNHEFVNFDDHLYVTENKPVQQGLTWEGVAWSFREPHVSNWHPITWLSHRLDCTLFDLNAGPHHVVNVIFHGVNSVLLLLLLVRMTGALWPAALVAALFAWHPLHVESVAWVAERKDVLSTGFGLLAIGAWLRHVERPSRARYGVALLWLVLGLMSKPMLVTLPFVLLLLDVWPLRRLRLDALGATPAGDKTNRPRAGTTASPAHSFLNSLWRLALEKWPFFLLSLVFSVVAVLTQRDMAMVPMERLPLAARLNNALISYARYLGKMVWPADLSVFYPFPQSWPLAWTGAAAVLLIAITWAVVRVAPRRPYLLVGWLWYLGTLVPVIGLVQVGGQSMADRYTYVPYIGLFIAVAWGLAEVTARWPRGRVLVGVAAAVALCGCLAVARGQLRHWKNSITLFEQAVRVTKNNWVAHYNLGLALAKAGRVDEAIAHYNEVTRIDPENLDALNNLGNVMAKQGRRAEAAALFTAVLKVRPDDVDALNNLSLALAETGKLAESVALLQRALQLQPNYAKAHQNLGLAYLELQRPDDAIKEFEAALSANPDLVEAHGALAFELLKRKRHAEAQAHFDEALRRRPDFVEAHTGMGLSLAAQSRLPEAMTHLSEAARLKPDDPRIRLYLGSTLAAQGRRTEALEQYRAAYQSSPDWPLLLANYAWLLAAAPEAQLRNGAQAVQMAERACELTRRQMVEAVDTLAAAYAETGRFNEAATTARQALALAKAGGNDLLAARIQQRIELYQASQPFREKP